MRKIYKVKYSRLLHGGPKRIVFVTMMDEETLKKYLEDKTSHFQYVVHSAILIEKPNEYQFFEVKVK